jgi:hypothetical protein
MPQNYAVRPDDKRLGGNRSLSYGIRVKNPLPMTVKVQVWEGKKIIREVMVEASRTKFIGVDKPGDYEVRSMIVDNVFPNSYDELGPGDIKVVDHEEVQEPEIEPVSLVETVTLEIPKEQKTARYWRDVVIWQVKAGATGELMAVEIEAREDVKWRLKMMKRGDGRFGGRVTELTGTTTFTDNLVAGGMIIKLQAKSLVGYDITVSGRISGRQTVVYETSDPPKVEINHVDEEEEVEVISMADRFREMEKEEVAV